MKNLKIPLIIFLGIGLVIFIGYYNESQMKKEYEKSKPKITEEDIEKRKEIIKQKYLDFLNRYNEAKEGETIEGLSLSPSDEKLLEEIKEEMWSNYQQLSEPTAKEDINLDSDQRRREAFKMALKLIVNGINNIEEGCKVVSQSYYQPILVNYRGNGIFKVTARTSFDCNQDYINDKVFSLTMIYQGNNQ